MTAEPKNFDLGDVPSVTTGILVSTRHIEGVYDILNFMTGESLFTHQLPAACRECEPVILAQHPALAEIEVPELGPDTAMPWLDQMKAVFGDTLPVTPLDRAAGKYSDPIGDLAAMTDAPIIVVQAP